MQPRASVASSVSSGGSEPDDIDSFRDIYIWGEVLTNGVSPDGTGIQNISKTDVLIPKPLDSNLVLDVCHIGSGTHHIAIVTKRGQVFTWGKELGGRLGHGIDKDFSQPHQVEFLEGTHFEFVACGEHHTGAISKSYELYMWGDGAHNVGLLGHGSEASTWIPKMVNGPLEGLQVVSVACGTWHSALATSNGKLFTFGDGAFGVLGHGDQETVMYPKEVQLLSGLKTIKVACGVWHTAAIIEVAFQSSSNNSPWKLYTWGDGDKYRLGHGNKETYLQPTRVASLMEYNFHQVACGNTMTIALTTSGHVFTMGGTEYGQLGNPMSLGKIPTLVQDKLLGEFVDEISCGAHHVAVLTTKGELYTWGMGANGRLGHGDVEDRKSPTLVLSLKDRNIKNISCGSSFTSCISMHKWIDAIDQSDCCGCRQAFGLTRKRHNCLNCGLVFCHACSSRKALKAALTSTPEKPHRVCDNCYVKLKVVDDNAAPKLDRKVTPDYTINAKERSIQGSMRSTRILLSPNIEPVKYLETKNTNLVNSPSSCLQLKDITFPSKVSSSQSILRPPIPISPPRTPPSPINSEFTSTHTRRQSSPQFVSPRSCGGVANLRIKNDLLNQEVSKLQKQIQSLMQRSDMQDVEIKKLNKKTLETSALAAVESSNHRITIEYVESIVYQLKNMTEKLPPEIPESKNFITLLTQVEDFLKENLESETSPSKLGSEQQNAPKIPTLVRGSYNLQRDILEENTDAARIDSCQENENIHQESHKLKLESKLQKHRIEENMNVAKVNPCQDEERNSKTEEHKQDKNVNNIKVDPCKDGENSLKGINGPKLEIEYQNSPNIVTATSDLSELLDALEDNVEVARVDQPRAQENVLQEGNGSRSLDNSGASIRSQNLNSGSRSLDPSKLEKQGEIQFIERFEHGVYVSLILRSDGIKIFNRVKFSKRRFTDKQAEEWWNQNKGRVLRKYYHPTHQKQLIEQSNVTSPVNKIIEASPS